MIEYLDVYGYQDVWGTGMLGVPGYFRPSTSASMSSPGKPSWGFWQPSKGPKAPLKPIPISNRKDHRDVLRFSRMLRIAILYSFRDHGLRIDKSQFAIP